MLLHLYHNHITIYLNFTLQQQKEEEEEEEFSTYLDGVMRHILYIVKYNTQSLQMPSIFINKISNHY